MDGKGSVKAALLGRLLPCSRFIYRMPASSGKLYLTFDDGPDPMVTPQLLDLLAENQVHATFFCIGEHLEQYRDLAERACREGHSLGNHSFHHRGFARLSLADQLAEITRTDGLLQQITGREQHPFRVPQGRWSADLLLRLLSRGTCCVHWSFDSLDYQREATEAFVRRLGKVSPVAGDVMLFHDDGDLCVKGLRELLPGWRAKGLEFAALPS